MDAVLFDLDGTLIDTTEAILTSLQHTLWYFTGEKRDKEHFRAYLGITLDEVLKDLVPDHARDAHHVYIDHNLGIHDKTVKPFPGTLETLAELRRGGLKLAVVTSKRRHSALYGMEIAGLLGYFDAKVFYEDTARHKPDPDPILKALDLLEVRRGSVLMVGDSIYDIRAAKNADALLAQIAVKSAGAAYGPSGRATLSEEQPDYILDSVSEVLSVFGMPPLT
ncbi:MAG TPA: HAD-IA family hydrolase [Firmicutes bacterium]|nr:HAD-IA family hydrolase [Candidatus Fermentithermobacillaceae bacterium]